MYNQEREKTFRPLYFQFYYISLLTTPIYLYILAELALHQERVEQHCVGIASSLESLKSLYQEMLYNHFHEVREWVWSFKHKKPLRFSIIQASCEQLWTLDVSGYSKTNSLFPQRTVIVALLS